MTSLVVLLPASGRLAAEAWDTVPLMFARLGRAGEVLEQGQAVVEALPRSDLTVLMLSACDTLLLKAALPPVTGARLQRTLPNVVEEHLVQDPQRCHICVDPDAAPDGARCLAVVDRDWLASLTETFGREGRGRLKVVPLIRCVPLPRPMEPPLAVESADAREALLVEQGSADTLEAQRADEGAGESPAETRSVLIVRYPGAGSAEGEVGEPVEIIVRQGQLGMGLEVDVSRVQATMAGIVQRGPVDIHVLSPAVPLVSGPELVVPGAGVISLADVAGAALACRFDLCQFDFARAARAMRGAKRWWQWSAALAGAAVIVALVALNVHWLQLWHQRDALNAQMADVLKKSFPEISVVMDPQAQMVSQLKRLSSQSGALREDDYLVEAAELSHALGPVPSASISALDYSNGTLSVTFRRGTTVDADGFRTRLAANGLSGREEDGKWMLASAAQRRP